MHWWFQNIAKEDRSAARKTGRRSHGPIIHVRGSIGRLRWEFCTGFNFALEVKFNGGNREWQLRFAPVLCSLYLTLGKMPQWLCPKGYEGKQTGIRIFDWAVWIEVWQNEHSWKRGDWTWSWHPLDTLLGRTSYSERDVETAQAQVAFPEKTYNLSIRFFESTWKRPRWFANRLVRADITPSVPIPEPGKGENSWDCGDDGCYSLITPADTVGKAIGAIYDTVMRERRKYGSGANMYVGRDMEKERAEEAARYRETNKDFIPCGVGAT
jgi:hypothetical protein